MKIKLVIDFLNNESYDVIKYLSEYKKTHPDLDLEIQGIELNKDKDINKAYCGLYYSNRFGVGLEYVKEIMDAHHLKNQDIGNLHTLAQCYKEIGYDEDDFIDGVLDGDFEDMHDFIQNMNKKKDIDKAFTVIIYENEDKKVFNTFSEMKEYIEIKKSTD